MTILNDTSLDTTAVPDTEVLIGEAAQRAVRDGCFDCIVKSPGVSLRRPEIAAAKAKGVRLTSPTNLWFEHNPDARVIAVSGTKGKSTTARLLHHLLTTAGFDAAMFGNVGIPVLGQTPGRDVTVLELSSYQIADLEYAPQMAVYTNLFPEHAPWHGGSENYFRDKLRLLELPGVKGVANFANDRLRVRLAERQGIVWFNARFGFSAHGESLLFNGTPVDCEEFPLHGEHNFSDLAAACTAADLFGANNLRRRVTLAGFVQLAHRLEEFSVGGRFCVNDSLSTVPEAALAALRAYAGRPIALMLGGFDRGQDYADLIDFLPQANLRCVLLLPETGARILAALRRRHCGFEYFSVPDLDAAVTEAFRRTQVGDVVLLSPAAPSFGQFRNYADRGDRFKTLCRAKAGLV